MLCLSRPKGIFRLWVLPYSLTLLKVVGRVLIKDLSDSFIEDWKAAFPPGKLVKAKVLK
jgi:hypothetical protein